jgi:hypothetical protein
MKFEIGQNVECIIFGVGKILGIFENHEYPIKVNFNNNKTPSHKAYTIDGKLFKEGNVCLTNGSWDIKEIQPTITYKQNEIVWAKLPNGNFSLALYKRKNNFHDDLHIVQIYDKSPYRPNI